MKFGPVPLHQAEGATLAHSVALSSGKLRKGLILTGEHVASLAALGLDEVIVARPEPGDVPEDEAAARIAEALVPDPGPAHLRLTRAFTGRVNLLATAPGVARLDPDRLNQLNRIDPMLTLATVPDHRQMSEGGMVATVKIISYAVPAAAVDEAETLLRGDAAIRVAPVRLATARLIVTEIPGGAGEKGVAAMESRLAALGMTLGEVVTVPHRQAEIESALTGGAAADLTLILTGSATSDPHDIAPEAVRAAGGRIERFGMPVDPGNLLFLGQLNDRPVIGLPGCARSPALNGADWVLARIACALPVTADDIAGMGVGGLLKEIPSRPQPRAGRT
ncbi:molybdopterin biosynthesis protein [Pseudooceanicola batsensis HTCC2597]|uniref:Molybdopterin biosynthesis protein n=1 Tax=Pseudooceanicola batsensis (strain ATCC BAA-863 / DSM 15984 / KCTC 12145 / HTCC2597) TaxID=252305 RepID=A3U1T3_PSEBH|nr:molybdopterin-binding protein [Pseudooceanicola batsensis]EAQ01867.1 molybdopterin biosynthesis protein [Pseudooceanicola batsensis HTCC2597]